MMRTLAVASVLTFIMSFIVRAEPAVGSISQGQARIVVENLFECAGARVSAVGEITAMDNTTWTVPAKTAYLTGTKAPDLYNTCSQTTPKTIAEIDIQNIPIVEVDRDGELITGYIFADNYFELYVNGKLIGVDPVPYSPFNSNIVRFRAKRPITYAVKLVDWEENLGIGSENLFGSAYHAGDGGFVANFSDGTVTDASWKAQVFYISPIESPDAIDEHANGSRLISSKYSGKASCKESCYAMHYPLPDNWHTVSYDDSHWPNAIVFDNETVGVRGKKSYTNFTDQFIGAGAKFIWSSDLVRDNLVIVRKTAK